MNLTLDVKLTATQLAAVFCAMNDEEQAQFFIEVAKIGSGWGMQWWMVGRHLRDCECSNPEARAVVTQIAEGIDPDET